MKRYLSKILLWERRSHSISYVGTPFPCVPAPLHYCTEGDSVVLLVFQVSTTVSQVVVPMKDGVRTGIRASAATAKEQDLLERHAKLVITSKATDV